LEHRTSTTNGGDVGGSERYRFIVCLVAISVASWWAGPLCDLPGGPYGLQSLAAQEVTASGSTAHLSSLIGTWDVERTYAPGSRDERTLTGSLVCAEGIGGAYIRCRYVLPRSGQTPAIEEVYFNYNPIYGRYEALWLSSTWPIKVVMEGHLLSERGGLVLSGEAEFPIQNGLIESVRSEHRLEKDGFVYRVFVRTSDSSEGVWREHMVERARPG
jgi:hypothetical protein